MTSRESELITTGIHRNGQHWAKAYDDEEQLELFREQVGILRLKGLDTREAVG